MRLLCRAPRRMKRQFEVHVTERSNRQVKKFRILMPKYYWQEQGWMRVGPGKYTGYYRVNGSRWKGLIGEEDDGVARAYIQDPPQEFKRHRHYGACLFGSSDPHWQFIHMDENNLPTNVDEALFAAQRRLELLTKK